MRLANMTSGSHRRGIFVSAATDRRRIAAFVALCVVSLAASAAYLVRAQARQPRIVRAGVVDPAAAPDSLGALLAEPHVLFRSTAPGRQGLVGLAHLVGLGKAAATGTGGGRTLLDLQCARVAFAGGNGLCLTDQGSLFTPYNIVFLGPDLQPRHQESLAGVISRARVSPDGRYGTATVFVSGHSYAPNTFSTQTTLYDMATGDLLGDLEHFDVYRDGKQIEAPDFNFWGVTFAGPAAGIGTGPGVFYATLGTAGHTYLVRGHVEGSRVDVLRDGVECPSLSPDGTRIAFKQRVGSGSGEQVWRPAVLDVATLADHPLSEIRNVDDQIEWLDDSTVVYAVKDGERVSTWAAPADGSGAPRLFLDGADSPAVVWPT